MWLCSASTDLLNTLFWKETDKLCECAADLIYADKVMTPQYNKLILCSNLKRKSSVQYNVWDIPMNYKQNTGLTVY